MLKLNTEPTLFGYTRKVDSPGADAALKTDGAGDRLGFESSAFRQHLPGFEPRRSAKKPPLGPRLFAYALDSHLSSVTLVTHR